MNICGTTKVYGLIGKPVSHSYSPLIQNTLIREFGYDSVYVCFNVDNLEDSVKGLISLGVEGFNVTMPYKESVMKYIDEFTDNASYVNAVNTVHVKNGKVYGHNTDCEGFIRSLKMSSGKGLKGEKTLLLGAGGAAKAVAVGCLNDGCEKLYIHNRTKARAEALKESLPEFLDRIEVISDISSIVTLTDVIINTTSVGMHPNINETPVPDNLCFNTNQRVIDIIYSPSETKLLNNARRQGAFVCNGFPMLFWQAVIAFEIWNDITLDEITIDKTLKDIMRYVYE